MEVEQKRDGENYLITLTQKVCINSNTQQEQFLMEYRLPNDDTKYLEVNPEKVAVVKDESKIIGVMKSG